MNNIKALKVIIDKDVRVLWSEYLSRAKKKQLLTLGLRQFFQKRGKEKGRFSSMNLIVVVAEHLKHFQKKQKNNIRSWFLM
jgi:hypothetical protein